ncbi:hypothetical protein J2128_000739 [Methanomicrobium sp. W14]|uniref:hypothetical protein n=1 Tax=Methanomicrobium sp. W14 TaxID=2817839 RepID=UPI001AE5BC00|nr:hypothetical protein [Methanomicrobium sp. W14]MBP2132818.1 hypothetical protein [Methanomicrobium sp. W14]
MTRISGNIDPEGILECLTSTGTQLDLMKSYGEVKDLIKKAVPARDRVIISALHGP